MIHPSWMLGCYDIPALMRMSITQTVMDFLITVLSCGICHPKFFHLAPVLLKLNSVLSCGKIHVKGKHQRTRPNICCTIKGYAVSDYDLLKIMWVCDFMFVWAFLPQVIMLLRLHSDTIIPECGKRNAYSVMRCKSMVGNRRVSHTMLPASAVLPYNMHILSKCENQAWKFNECRERRAAYKVRWFRPEVVQNCFRRT